jgi:hypothetical protein
MASYMDKFSDLIGYRTRDRPDCIIPLRNRVPPRFELRMIKSKKMILAVRYAVRKWAGLIWLRIGTTGGFL